MEETTSPLTYIEATVDYEGKPYLQMAIPANYLSQPCDKCALHNLYSDCHMIEKVLHTGRQSRYPCVDNIRRREFVFIKPIDHDEFIAHMVAIRMGAENG